VLLLVGGTDGGDADVLLHNARTLARARMRAAVVVAGNADATAEVLAVLAAAGRPVVATANVLPRIGELQPGPARAAIREAFLRHVIGGHTRPGRRLSKGGRFAALVRAATPDAVLAAVELLATQVTGDLAVVDVGGATTDVYSARTPDPDAKPGVAGTLWHARTVEGDLGLRWSAPGLVAAAQAERLLDTDDPLAGAAQDRADRPGLLTADGTDLRLATLAATIGLRRHARAGNDLRDVRLVIGSGGVLRHAAPEDAVRVLDRAVNDHGGGWATPRAPHVVVDQRYVLAAAGLLAADHPQAAIALLRDQLYPA
jgi:hypothetical protein